MARKFLTTWLLGFLYSSPGPLTPLMFPGAAGKCHDLSVYHERNYNGCAIIWTQYPRSDAEACEGESLFLERQNSAIDEGFIKPGIVA